MPSAHDPGTTPSESALDCLTARALVHRFLAADEAVAERARLRAHLAACDACREHYRDSVAMLATFAARGWRPGASYASRSARAQAGTSRRRKGAAKMLWPVFALCALWAISGGSTPRARAQVVALDGPVRVGSTALALGLAPQEIARGQTCSTGSSGRASVAAGSARLVLEPSTDVMIERATPLRVRLFAGSLLYEGEVVVVSERGIVATSPGAGIVRAEGKHLLVACSTGHARMTDPEGDHPIAPGESACFALAAR